MSSRHETIVGPSGSKQQDVNYRLQDTSTLNALSSTSLSLPSNQKLKGTENYSAWKVNMKNLADLVNLTRFFTPSKMFLKPPKVDKENCDTASEEEFDNWFKWKTGDSKAKLALSYNVVSGVQKTIDSAESAESAWLALEKLYGGSEGLTMWKAIHDLIAINCDSYTKVEDYASAFNKAVEKLETIGAGVNKKWIPFLFVYRAQNTHIV
jgi:hypothetical protein